VEAYGWKIAGRTVTIIDMSSVITKTTNVIAMITRNSFKPLIYSCSNSSSMFWFVVVVAGALELSSSALFATSLEGAASWGRPSSKFALRIFSSFNLFSVSMTGTYCDAGTVEEIQVKSQSMPHSLLRPSMNSASTMECKSYINSNQKII
jgi:hypothetical protein